MHKIMIFTFLLISPLISYAHGITEEAKNAMIDGGYLQFVLLGAEHMITGYDHLLFLFGVIFFLKSFKDIVKFISIFTLGHSITLIFATFMGISANYWLIDAVIALSVCYKGFDNNKGFQNYLGFKMAPNILFMVFLFGLIHGFGLSTRLQQLPLGNEKSDLLLKILSFNIGVEFGQIAALALMLLVLSQIRKFKLFDKLSKVLNHGLILAGFLLFLMQIHGYMHTSHPDEFGFSEDNHIHHHMDLYKKNNSNHQHDNL